MSESIQKKKGRVRPPRVHIEYEVELNGAMVMKDLPFVVGVMADLAGSSKKEQPPLKKRQFSTVDRDNFNSYLASLEPRAAMKVENKLEDDGSDLSVELEFRSMDDFRPENVAKQVGPLNDLLEVRKKLKDLLSRTEGNDRLEELLEAIINDSAMRDKLKDTLGITGDEGAAGDSEQAAGEGEN